MTSNDTDTNACPPKGETSTDPLAGRAPRPKDNDVSRNLPNPAFHDSVNALMLDVKQQMQKVVDSNEEVRDRVISVELDNRGLARDVSELKETIGILHKHLFGGSRTAQKAPYRYCNTAQTAQQKEKLIPRKRANPTVDSKGQADVDTSVDAYDDEPDGGLTRKVAKPNVGQPRQTKMDTWAASEISPDEDSSASSLFSRFKGKTYGYDGRYPQLSKRTDFKLRTSAQPHLLRRKAVPPRSNITRSAPFKVMASKTHRDHANAHASKSSAMGDMAMPQHRRDLCGYVFKDEADQTEVLLQIREHTAMRSDFACLGNRAQPISSRLIELFALMMASNEGAGAGEVDAGALWCLHPKFAEDVKDEIPDEILAERYVKNFMCKSKAVQFLQVYVPNFYDESKKQWYLAVADLSGEMVFHLDTNFNKDIRKKRRQVIDAVMRALHRIARSKEFPGIKFMYPTNMGDWDVCGSAGQPRNSNTRDSALLVMQWMTMRTKFCMGSLMG
ncbi:hypothetical protein PIB30_056681 [Stylosanthes scabra]|uniref:Ubiquitin-like protease family profile domain-containing protein n=1 Tax=Stylosanthes scabra TaxID=79078 RepID=A0ABU6YIB0_9FABA|nr:hypothetical protein [Stylosanthes scabra]